MHGDVGASTKFLRNSDETMKPLCETETQATPFRVLPGRPSGERAGEERQRGLARLSGSQGLQVSPDGSQRAHWPARMGRQGAVAPGPKRQARPQNLKAAPLQLDAVLLTSPQLDSLQSPAQHHLASHSGT